MARVVLANRLTKLQIGLNTAHVLLIGISVLPIWFLLVIMMKNRYQFDINRWGLTLPFRLGNFVSAWEIVRSYMWNTLLVAIVGVLGVLAMSLFAGHVFARMEFRFKRQLYLAVIILLSVPFVLSFIPSYMMFYKMGLINTIWSLIIPNLANGPVFGIFLLTSSISGIPKDLYEAAKCDGANVFQEVGRISLPLSLPSLATLALWNFVGTWNWYLWPLVVITDKQKQLISVGLTRLAESSADVTDWGPQFAGYFIASVPLVILFIFLGKYYVEGMVSSGIKM